MPLNCKLNRNISFNQPGSGGDDGCNGQNISEGVGGISKVVVYNISDVQSLTFEGDNRSDHSLYVDTINSTGQFYTVDFTSASYNEEYDSHKWTHTLTLEIANISTLFEDILSDGVNGKYLVCFLPNGAEDWRCFGWKYGASLDYSLNINSDSLGYTVVFDDISEFPLLAVDKDNFGDKNKTYSPIFKPLWDVYICEQGQDNKHTGYAIAMYVVKVNAAGQPLDSSNKLCQWTGNKQDAFRYQEISSDGGYNIIGTYASDATFDGRPVKVFDLDKCSADVENSIYINQKKNELITLNSTITGSTFTITSTDDWKMSSEPQYVTINPTSGENGNTICDVYHNGVGGVEYIQFMNVATHEIVTLEVIINLIKIGENYTYPNSTTDIILTPIVQGCNTAFTYTITPSVTNSVDSDGNIHITFPSTTDELEYTLTTVHGCDSNEVKVTHIRRNGTNVSPDWVLSNDYCEVEDGQYTGYRIQVYTDYNPSSPTYMTQKEEKTSDANCSEASPNWVVVSSYCEQAADGTNTGYFVTVMTDLNSQSPTYGETRETKEKDTVQCPLTSDDPNWVLDGEFDPYCEQMIYEPSMTEGNTGRIIFRMKDANLYSPTYNQTMESAITESDWTAELQDLFGDFPCEAPSTEPVVEEITRYCETEEVESQIKYTGYAVITGMDKNPYSQTYLSTVTVRELDSNCGAEGCTCNDLQVVSSCSCDDLQTTPDTPTDFESMLKHFNDVLSGRGKTVISATTTPLVYDYLESGYTRALQEYESTTSPLFNENSYDEIYNYRGSNETYKETAKTAMLSWLMAMQLSELYADSGHTTNTQTELFKKAYELGGGRGVPVYNNNEIHSDVFIARYAASAIYAIKRGEKSFSEMDAMRSQVNTSVINRTTTWTDFSEVTIANCDGVYSNDNNIGWALNLYDIFPNAAGPYADNFYNGGLICRTVAARRPDPEQPMNQFNTYTKNYLVDETIDNIVVSNYNLSASDSDLARTVQAVADEEDDVLHMFGNETYYKCNTASPKTTFRVGTPTDNNGYFNGTFNCNVTGKDLSSLLSNTNDSNTDLRNFFAGVLYIGGHSRKTILDPQYGRRRPGQGEGDALYNGDTVILTSTPRCRCNAGCDTHLNYLIDSSISRLVGTGTKLDSNHYYYVDSNGDGEKDSGEPYYNDGQGGTTNECAGLRATTYPSGHSAEVWTVGLLLMQMLPERYTQIYKAAYDFTVSRTILRAHWNSDIMYGKLVGTTIVPVINALNNASDANYRTLYNAAKTIIDNASECGQQSGETISVNLIIKNNTNSSISLNRKIKFALENDNHYGWEGCYNRYDPIDTSGTWTIPAHSSITISNLEFAGSANWTTVRHFLNVNTCQLFRDAYPGHTNVFLYDTNGESERYIPDGISPSINIMDGQTYTININ